MQGTAGRRVGVGWRGLVGLAIFGLLALAAGYAWQAGVFRVRVDLDPARIPKLGPSAFTLVRGVHVLGGLAPSAAYAVETPDGFVLFDTGLEADAGPLRAQLGRVGLDMTRLRAIFLTHAHGDHTGGAGYLRAMTHAPVHAGRGDAPVLRAGGPREAFFSTFDMPGVSTHATTVDVELAGGETFDFGPVRVTAIAAPGHTPGSVCYLVERDGLRIFVSGDVVMRLRGDDPPRPGQDGPLGTYSAYLAPRYRGDAAAYLGTLRRLRALPPPDLLLPGHPSGDPTPQSPLMTAARWAEILDEGVRDMETLVARYNAGGADFLDGVPKELLPGLLYLGDREGAAVYGLVTPSKFVLVDAPGGPGLLAFVKERLGALGHAPRAPDVVLLTACDARATSGLGEIAGPGKAVVAAPTGGRSAAEAACPPGTTMVSPGTLEKDGLPVLPVPLRGRGTSPTAYVIPWAGKPVLVAGLIPVKLNQSTGLALFDDFLKGRGDADAYLESIARLRNLTPDLWLPALPTDGQNANLYDHDWQNTLDQNRVGIERNRRLILPTPR